MALDLTIFRAAACLHTRKGAYRTGKTSHVETLKA